MPLSANGFTVSIARTGLITKVICICFVPYATLKREQIRELIENNLIIILREIELSVNKENKQSYLLKLIIIR